MQRRWIIALLLTGAGLAAWHAASDRQPLAAVSLASPAPYDIPDAPAEWRGRIDYRALDRDLAALSLRPEMAGLAVAVVENGRLSFVGTYGTADKSTGAPVTPETLFRWASVSKTATGMLAARLAAEGSIDLNRPVASWRTSLRLPGGAEMQLTLAQVLSQQTGLTEHAYDEKLEEGQNPALLRASLASAPLQCPPGTCYTYQNVAFDTASEVLAQAAGTGFDEAMTARLFRPLGMTSAGMGMARLTSARDWARPHNGSAVVPMREAYWRVPAAAGIDSNIVDFATWMRASMGLRADLLPAPILQTALQPRVATARPYGGALRQALSDAHYGLGWRTFAYNGRTLAGHSGAVAGYRATMIFDPATRTGAVAMWNSNWGVPFRIPFAVLDRYHQVPESRWLDLSDLPAPGSARPPL